MKKSEIKELIDKNLNIVSKDFPENTPNNVTKSNKTTDQVVQISRQPRSKNYDLTTGNYGLGFRESEDKEEKSNENEELLEKLSELEHIQWEKWSKELAEKENLSKDRVERWKKDWVPYSELTNEIKEYDREWARKAMEIFKKFSKKTKTIEEVKDIVEVIVKKPEAIDFVKKDQKDVSKKEKEIVKKNDITKIVEKADSKEGLFKGKWSENSDKK